MLNVKLSYCDKRQKNVSILDLPGDVLIIPQVVIQLHLKWMVLNKFISNFLFAHYFSLCYRQIPDSFRDPFTKLLTAFFISYSVKLKLFYFSYYILLYT